MHLKICVVQERKNEKNELSEESEKKNPRYSQKGRLFIPEIYSVATQRLRCTVPLRTFGFSPATSVEGKPSTKKKDLRNRRYLQSLPASPRKVFLAISGSRTAALRR